MTVILPSSGRSIVTAAVTRANISDEFLERDQMWAHRLQIGVMDTSRDDKTHAYLGHFTELRF